MTKQIKCRGYRCGALYDRRSSGGTSYLCPACNAVPPKLRKLNSQHRSDKRRRELAPYGSVPSGPEWENAVARSGDLAAGKDICNTRMEFIDRGCVAGFKKYWSERGWHFRNLYGLEPTEANLAAKARFVLAKG